MAHQKACNPSGFLSIHRGKGDEDKASQNAGLKALTGEELGTILGDTISELENASMDIDEAISRIEGITCGMKKTSCPDQLAQALKQIKELESNQL